MIVDILKTEIENEIQKKLDRKPPTKFYPSSAGACNRSILYKMLGYESEPLTPISYQRMENGSYVHERIQKMIRNSPAFIADEFVIAGDFISGRGDVLIKNMQEHEPSDIIIKITDREGKILYEGPHNDVMVVEIKSIKHEGYENLRNDAKPEHKSQLFLYMGLLNIPYGEILYEDKNTQEMKEYSYEYNEEEVSKVFEQVKTVKYHFDNKTLPDREFKETSFQCMYCDFKHICWTGDTGGALDELL